ncbi:hypothetical protein MY4824_003883 [Beauveria thailandica]
MASPGLDRLPTELLLEIARCLWLGDMSHLARVNRRFYQVLDPILYLTDAEPYNQYALFWAAEHNLLTVAERALRAGTPVQPHNDSPSPLRPFGRILTGQELEAVTYTLDPDTPLSIAVTAGHCAIAALLLRDPRLPSLMDSWDFMTAFHAAISGGHVEMVDMLLRHMEHVHKESMPQQMPAFFEKAAWSRNIALVKLFIENGARLALIPRDVYSAHQMRSAGTGSDELWDLYSSIRPLELASYHDLQREDLQSSLDTKAYGNGSRGIVELVKTFTSLGFNWKYKGVLARMLRMALGRDNVPLMELLLSYSSNEKKGLKTLISLGSFGIHPGPEVCKWLLARGCGREVWDRAFATALGQRDTEKARLLLSIVDGIPAYIQDRGGKMLKAACSMSFPELAQLVLSPLSAAERRKLVQDAEPKLTGRRSLLSSLLNSRPAGEEKRLETARLVLEAGADPNSETSWSKSLLRTACKKGLPGLASLLLKYGANSLQAGQNGTTILHVACRYCPKLAFIEELLKSGADVMARCDYGTTPLHHLCYPDLQVNERVMGPMARYQVAKLLISNGADPNADNGFGNTPLHFACRHESLCKMCPEDAKVVVALLEHGANIEHLNSLDEKPLFVACAWLNHPVASILLEKGADRSRETLWGFAERYPGLMWRDRFDNYAHEMVKLLLSYGVDRVFVTEEMMDSLGPQVKHYETVRLLLMHGVDVEVYKLIFGDGEKPSRTKALAEALKGKNGGGTCSGS